MNISTIEEAGELLRQKLESHPEDILFYIKSETGDITDIYAKGINNSYIRHYKTVLVTEQPDFHLSTDDTT